MLAMPAHSVWIDTPAVRDGLQFGVFTNVSPNLVNRSNKFTYTLGDPRIFDTYDRNGNLVTEGTLADVMANQDRQDSDRRIREDGTDGVMLQLAARQVLTKDLLLRGSIAINYNSDSYRNYGALWGVTLDYKEDLSVTIGDGWSRLPVRQTDVDNIIQQAGNNISVESTHIPDLTLNAYHAFNASSNVYNRQLGGWRTSTGASAKYLFDINPYHKITVAAGGTVSKGNENPYFTNTPSKGKSYLLGASYDYKDLTVGLDYGQQKTHYNGLWSDNMKTTVYGIKTSYNFTPRLAGTLSYAYREDNNNKSVSIDDLVSNPNLLMDRGYNYTTRSLVFDKSKQERYGIDLEYQLYKGLTINAGVTDTRTRTYVTEGEFSRRKMLETSLGARFAF
ncbi:hypothetical protein B0189_00320 [Moraxella cuniculi]|nr:hypothetical protein B0189_00320 [Moraxella cuniculi]